MECMWCSSTKRCVDSNAYIISFPYGQCLEWQTATCSREYRGTDTALEGVYNSEKSCRCRGGLGLKYSPSLLKQLLRKTSSWGLAYSLRGLGYSGHVRELGGRWANLALRAEFWFTSTWWQGRKGGAGGKEILNFWNFKDDTPLNPSQIHLTGNEACKYTNPRGSSDFLLLLKMNFFPYRTHPD